MTTIKESNLSLDGATIEAIHRMKGKSGVFNVKLSEKTVKVLAIEGIGDNQRDGAYVVEAIYVINGKTYQRAPVSWDK